MMRKCRLVLAAAFSTAKHPVRAGGSTAQASYTTRQVSSGFVSNVTLPSASVLHPPQSSRTDFTLLLLMVLQLACCSLYLLLPLLYLRKGPGSNSARKAFPPKPRWISRRDKKNMCWLWTVSKAQCPVWDTLSSFVHLLFMLHLSENLPLSSEPFSLTQKSNFKSFYMETFPLNLKSIIFMSLYSMTIFPLNSKLLGDICGFMSQWLDNSRSAFIKDILYFLIRNTYICPCLGLDYVHVEYMNKCPQRPEEVFGFIGTGVLCNYGLGTQLKSSTGAVHTQLPSHLSSPYFMLYF